MGSFSRHQKGIFCLGFGIERNRNQGTVVEQIIEASGAETE